MEAYGGAQYRLTQEIADKLSEAIRDAKTPIVPGTVVNMGGKDAGSNTVLDALMNLLTLSKVGVNVGNGTAAKCDPYRDEHTAGEAATDDVKEGR